MIPDVAARLSELLGADGPRRGRGDVTDATTPTSPPKSACTLATGASKTDRFEPTGATPARPERRRSGRECRRPLERIPARRPREHERRRPRRPHAYPFTYSIAVVETRGFCVTESDTRTPETAGRYDQLDGIHILSSSDGEVLANQVDQGAGAGADGDDGPVAHTMGGVLERVRYAGNKVRGGRHGAAMQLAVDGGEIRDLVIEGNELWGSPGGVVSNEYGARAAIRRVTIRRNVFRDNALDAVDLRGELDALVIKDNEACRSGAFKIAPGQGNDIASNDPNACN